MRNLKIIASLEKSQCHNIKDRTTQETDSSMWICPKDNCSDYVIHKYSDDYHKGLQILLECPRYPSSLSL